MAVVDAAHELAEAPSSPEIVVLCDLRRRRTARGGSWRAPREVERLALAPSGLWLIAAGRVATRPRALIQHTGAVQRVREALAGTVYAEARVAGLVSLPEPVALHPVADDVRAGGPCAVLDVVRGAGGLDAVDRRALRDLLALTYAWRAAVVG